MEMISGYGGRFLVTSENKIGKQKEETHSSCARK
jgi:hypothetical protein